LGWATSAAVVETTLRRRRGVLEVVASAVSQTATVTYDPDSTNVAELSGWVRDCGYHCSGASVPEHVCDPMAEPARDTGEGQGAHKEEGRSAQDIMGHGGGHGGMSMEDMVRDTRNRSRSRPASSVPAFGLVLRPEIAALSMSGSSLIVAVNALLLKRLKLPLPATPTPQAGGRVGPVETPGSGRGAGHHVHSPSGLPLVHDARVVCSREAHGLGAVGDVLAKRGTGVGRRSGCGGG